MINANLISSKTTSNSTEAKSLFAKSRFGEKYEDKIIYSPFEALFLLKQEHLTILDYRNKNISQKEFIKKTSKKDKNFEAKYIVFEDLRKKGYIVKTALKFGAEFRVYDKGSKITKDHSRWICFPVTESEKMTWHNFVAKNRVAHSTKKNLLIAVVDDENQISYFEIKWNRI
jgi:tRNA-intron endonuclease